MSTATYDIKKSRVKEDQLAAFIMDELVGDLQSVPGIGPTTERQLKDAGIDDTFMLLGKFLMCRKEGCNRQDMCNEFVEFLQKVGVTGFRCGITTCICEKAAVSVAGLFEEED
jgi:hypothetical protein